MVYRLLKKKLPEEHSSNVVVLRTLGRVDQEIQRSKTEENCSKRLGIKGKQYFCGKLEPAGRMEIK